MVVKNSIISNNYTKLHGVSCVQIFFAKINKYECYKCKPRTNNN